MPGPFFCFVLCDLLFSSSGRFKYNWSIHSHIGRARLLPSLGQSEPRKFRKGEAHEPSAGPATLAIETTVGRVWDVDSRLISAGSRPATTAEGGRSPWAFRRTVPPLDVTPSE